MAIAAYSCACGIICEQIYVAHKKKKLGFASKLLRQ